MKRVLLSLILLIPMLLSAQSDIKITGQVIDASDGVPVMGASIYLSSAIIGSKTSQEGIIDSSMRGTTTDFDGYFTFKVSKDIKNITISYIGYQTKVIDISINTQNLIIKLQQDSQSLEEVVLTGYQKIEKRKMTSSYVSIKLDDIEQVGVANVDQLLSGQIAGLSTTTTTGAPGSPVSIQIRGIASLSGSSEPLWVLDGIPLEGNEIPKDYGDKDNIDQLQSYAIGGLNPSDIESITVLKDASATAIYGARAANGVIVITSKRGKKGPMRISAYVNSFITQKPDFDKLNLMNSSEKIDFELFLASRSDLNYRTKGGEVYRILDKYNDYAEYQNNGFSAISLSAQQEINQLRKVNNNWNDLFYQTAVNSQYGLSISGGGDDSDYYFSAGFFKEKGTTIGTQLQKVNLTLKNNFKINDKLDAGISIFLNQNKTDSYITGADSYTNPSNYSRNVNPYLQVLDSDGNYIYDPDLGERQDEFTTMDYNILEERANTDHNLTNTGIKAIANVGYDINDNLRIETQLGVQLDKDSTEKYASEDSYFARKKIFSTQYTNPDTNEYDYRLPDGGMIQNWESTLQQYNWKNSLKYSVELNDIHEIDILLGTELRANQKTIIATKAYGFNSKSLTSIPLPEELSSLSSNRPYQKSFTENRFVSFFATASYTYDYKYTVFGSIRYDGSNLFGVSNKYRYLPLWSLAGSWNIHKEDFMENLSFVQNLKLRVSYGVQGNIDRSTSPFVIGGYNTAEILPGVSEDVLDIDSPPNADLRWEKTTSSNIGLDFGLFSNRLTIVSDFYFRESSDLIGIKTIPLETGYRYTNTNWATVTNKGFELAFSFKVIQKKDFNWITNLNISANKSEIKQIEIRKDDFKPSRQGDAVNAVYAIKTAGIDEAGLPLFWKDGEKVSAIEFYNLSESTTGSQLEREDYRKMYSVVGNSDPKYTGGIINRFKYKNFSLNISANFNIKRTVTRNIPYHPTRVEPGINYTTEILNQGTSLPSIIGLNSPGSDTSKVYQWFTYDVARTYESLDIWVKDISYIRINSIKLNYSLDKKILKALKMSRVQVYVEGRNLFVFGTKHDGYFDPETYGNVYSQPIPKVVAMGINVSF